MAFWRACCCDCSRFAAVSSRSFTRSCSWSRSWTMSPRSLACPCSRFSFFNDFSRLLTFSCSSSHLFSVSTAFRWLESCASCCYSLLATIVATENNVPSPRLSERTCLRGNVDVHRCRLQRVLLQYGIVGAAQWPEDHQWAPWSLYFKILPHG